jgi:hypothetical protein
MIIKTFGIESNYNLQMPLSNGTVTTPYDSRMIEQRDELQALIVLRTKRKLRARSKIIRTNQPVQTPTYIVAMASILAPLTIVMIAISPLFIQFPIS